MYAYDLLTLFFKLDGNNGAFEVGKFGNPLLNFSSIFFFAKLQNIYELKQQARLLFYLTYSFCFGYYNTLW